MKKILVSFILLSLILFLLDGSHFYYIDYNDIPSKNMSLLGESSKKTTLIDSKNNNNNSYIFLYRIKDRYAIFVYNRSLFLNRWRLESFVSDLELQEEFGSAYSTQLYDTMFSITEKNQSYKIDFYSKKNNKLKYKIVFIIILSINSYILTYKRYNISNVQSHNNKEGI